MVSTRRRSAFISPSKAINLVIITYNGLWFRFMTICASQVPSYILNLKNVNEIGHIDQIDWLLGLCVRCFLFRDLGLLRLFHNGYFDLTILLNTRLCDPHLRSLHFAFQALKRTYLQHHIFEPIIGLQIKTYDPHMIHTWPTYDPHHHNPQYSL